MASIRDNFSRLDECLLERMQTFRTPALVTAFTDRDRLIHQSALGYASLASKASVRPDHLFPIGSIGKAFTGVAALRLSEAGLLDLHAPLVKYLPWFEIKSSFAPITIHHLLTHSSGLPRGTDFSPDPRYEVYGLRKQPAGFEPGTRFAYSDLGYKALGLVLEQAAGKTYADLIRELILEPLGMTHTYAMTTYGLRPHMPMGYRHLYDDRPAHPTQPLVPAAWLETNSADGCIVSTAEDVTRFARMLLNRGRGPDGPVLSLESWQVMTSPQIEDEGEAYSYGLYLFEDEGYRHAGHGGDVPGYECYLWLDLDNCLGTVVLETTPHTPRSSFIALEYFRALYLGDPLPEPPPMPNFTYVAHAADYTGRYRLEKCSAEQQCSEKHIVERGELSLEADGHHLVLVRGEQRVLLEERGPDRFYANDPAWDRYLLQFGRSDEGDVVEVFYGPHWLINERYQGPRTFPIPAEWPAYAGHYRSHNPWETNFRVFPRKGQLILAWPAGDEEVLVPLEDGAFRIGEEPYIPERLAFDQVVDGQALRAIRSGCPYYRFFTP